MKIVAFRIFRFRLKLNKPLKLKDTTIDGREGFLVELRSGSGGVAYGEVSPLPRFSKETLEQIHDQLNILRKDMVDTEIPPGLEKLDGGFDNWLGQWKLASSVRFGIESAVLNLVALEQGRDLADLLGGFSRAGVTVNALLSGSKEEVISQAIECAREGYRCVKVKIGGLTLEDAFDLVRGVRDEIGSEIALRVDANRSLMIGDALDLFGKIAECDVEYVEEPVRNLNQLRTLLMDKNRTVPVALDESLLEIEPEDLSQSYRIKAIVIKPTLIGLEKAVLFARRAAGTDITPVVSSSFESSVGIRVLAALAGVTPSGLDTLSWMAEDVVDNPVHIVGGKIDRESFTGGITVNRDMLEEIPIE